MPAYRRLMGDMNCLEDVTITLLAKGNIHCRRYELGADAEHYGNIFADEAQLSGTFFGDIHAKFVLLKPTAHVHGMIHTKNLTMEEGASFNGQRLDPSTTS